MGTLEGVDEQQAAVGHVEHAFHFTAEVGVARSVDDVDLGVPIVDRYVLGKDGDARSRSKSLLSSMSSPVC